MQPPTTPPPNPSTFARAVSWVTSDSHAGQVGLGCGGLIAVCLCGALAVALATSGGTPSTAHAAPTSTATATNQTASPTATATLTPQTAPPGQSPGPAVLGGTGQAFIDQYGPLITSQSDTSRGDLHFRQYAGVAQDFLIVELGVYLGIAPGDQNAVYILVSAPPSTTWTVSQANAACGAFFPLDARRISSAPARDSSGSIIGVDVIYQSDTLIHVFPTSAFLDVSQNPTTPGSFDVMYLYAPPNRISSQIDSCSIGLGTQQT
jgi:hypothetical protein